MTPLPSHEFFEGLLRPRGLSSAAAAASDPPKKQDPFVVVSFSAKWCGPCQRIDKKSLVTLTPHVKWYSCDVDENDVTLGYCGLQSIPGFVIIRDGHFLDRKAGANGVADILAWLQKHGVPIDM